MRRASAFRIPPVAGSLRSWKNDGAARAWRGWPGGSTSTVARSTTPQAGRGGSTGVATSSARGTVVQFSEALCAAAELASMRAGYPPDACPGGGLSARRGVGLTTARLRSSGRIPTGLHGEWAAVLGAAVRADLLSHSLAEAGLYVAGADHVGEILFADLGVPLDRVRNVAPRLRLFDESVRASTLPRRSRTAHKGDFGHVLVVGGNDGMGGAVRLAGEAALRSGAGLVSVATRPDNVTAVTGYRPELMCRGVSAPADIEPLLKRATVIAIGPGLGQDTWAENLLERVFAADQPLVVDADAPREETDEDDGERNENDEPGFHI